MVYFHGADQDNSHPRFVHYSRCPPHVDKINGHHIRTSQVPDKELDCQTHPGLAHRNNDVLLGICVQIRRNESV